jgi:hypothetical protein
VAVRRYDHQPEHRRPPKGPLVLSRGGSQAGRRTLRLMPTLGVWPLVGRAEEIDHALTALTSTRGAVLSGVPGVGKSHLGAEVLRAAADNGWATVQRDRTALGVDVVLPLVVVHTLHDVRLRRR